MVRVFGRSVICATGIYRIILVEVGGGGGDGLLTAR